MSPNVGLLTRPNTPRSTKQTPSFIRRLMLLPVHCCNRFAAPMSKRTALESKLPRPTTIIAYFPRLIINLFPDPFIYPKLMTRIRHSLPLSLSLSLCIRSCEIVGVSSCVLSRHSHTRTQIRFHSRAPQAASTTKLGDAAVVVFLSLFFLLDLFCFVYFDFGVGFCKKSRTVLKRLNFEICNSKMDERVIGKCYSMCPLKEIKL